MSGVEERDSVESVEEGGKHAEAVAVEGAARLPDDVWGLILRYNDFSDNMALQLTSSWLHEVVMRSLPSAVISGDIHSFPTALLASLTDVRLVGGIDLSLALPVLQNCSCLRRLSLFGFDRVASDAVLTSLPLFPQLCSVQLQKFVLDGRLGRALAACGKLHDVSLLMRVGAARDIDGFSSFLCELAACAGLRKLSGVCLRSKDDKAALCTAVRAWSQLEQLQVALKPAFFAAGALRMQLDPIVEAVSSAGSQLRTLRLSSTGDSSLGRSGLLMVTELAQLRELQIGDNVALPPSFFNDLRSLSKLQRLTVTSRRFADCKWDGAAAFVACQPLRRLSLTIPPAACIDVLGAIAGHRWLTAVCMRPGGVSRSDAEQTVLAEALAEAVVASPVQRWQFSLTINVLAFLRLWRGRTPVAEIRQLKIGFCDPEPGVRAADVAALLLACLRSCASLRVWPLDFRAAWSNRLSVREATAAFYAELIPTLVADVMREPLAPQLLRARVERVVMEKYREQRASLEEAGLCFVLKL
eukprot:PLAT15475.7.p1 GENE.PLAT15475.7~~PLAT15475.7.p1  ORF type:complete len:527 (-),score=130.21 PLAT15475.7:81-1661(-)